MIHLLRKETNMTEIKRGTPEALRLQPFFTYTEETLVQSFFDGEFGVAWADDPLKPTCAAIYAGGFCFFAGDDQSPHTRELLCYLPDGTDFVIYVPENEKWAELFQEAWQGKYDVWNRFAIKKEGDIFDRKTLEQYAGSLTEPFIIRQIDAELYDRVEMDPLFTDFVYNFEGKEDFLRRGIGFIALDGDKVAGGASSYTIYHGGIEIEVDTDEKYRQKGIATACASRLILHCLENGLYPSWDAANMISVRLAEKLGYHFDYEYIVYAVDLKKGE